MSAASAAPFFSTLEARVRQVDSLLCVGLDPHSSDLASFGVSAEGALAFCLRLVAATHASAAAFKPNSAFFEAFGAPGLDALAQVCAAVRATGAVCLLDSKRGDISTTAEAYAQATFGEQLRADAVTVNGYMGNDGVEPFSRDASKGVFVLCKTSNPTSAELQTLPLASGSGGQLLYQALAALATGPLWNARGNIGLVVGATDTAALAGVRAVAPRAWILAPGVGFQGGDLATVLATALRPDGMGLLLPVSRGISRAADPGKEAEALRAAINAGRAAAAAAAAAAPAAAAATSALSPHSRDFLQAALAAGVLKFGSFTLKSGRQSPYFFNAGNFRSGASVAALGRTYAGAIAGCGVPFDVLFGPAYKGIPLATVAAAALADHHGLDVPFAYNRKEAKGHGEGGSMVGAELTGKRVLIVDDVISAGTAIGESVELIRAAGGIPVAVVIGLDRQERGGGSSSEEARSAVQAVQETYGIPVTAVATLGALVGFLEAAAAQGKDLPGLPAAGLGGMLASVREYRATWGVGGV